MHKYINISRNVKHFAHSPLLKNSTSAVVVHGFAPKFNTEWFHNTIASALIVLWQYIQYLHNIYVQLILL